LIVRGACTLRPGIRGLSDNIRVRSVVGRFLEHHRIYYFRNGGADDVYLASADWMGRNLFRRIEVAWPVLDGKLKRRVLDEGLRAYLDDTVDAWTLKGDGTYVPPKALARGDRGGFSAQRALLAELAASVGEG
ncbi:MAG: RNA degradosome polyphosphate kinase, partial [Burkholderiaceae bacterium]